MKCYDPRDESYTIVSTTPREFLNNMAVIIRDIGRDYENADIWTRLFLNTLNYTLHFYGCLNGTCQMVYHWDVLRNFYQYEAYDDGYNLEFTDDIVDLLLCSKVETLVVKCVLDPEFPSLCCFKQVLFNPDPSIFYAH